MLHAGVHFEPHIRISCSICIQGLLSSDPDFNERRSVVDDHSLPYDTTCYDQSPVDFSLEIQIISSPFSLNII